MGPAHFLVMSGSSRVSEFSEGAFREQAGQGDGVWGRVWGMEEAGAGWCQAYWGFGLCHSLRGSSHSAARTHAGRWVLGESPCLTPRTAVSPAETRERSLSFALLGAG